MTPQKLRLALGVAVLLAALAPAAAQVDKGKGVKDDEDYKRAYKKPVTVAQFWAAIKYEVRLGSYPVAAGLLGELLKKKPKPEELVNDVYERGGLVGVLRLKTVRRWSDDAKVDAQAKKDVDTFIQLVQDAVKKKYGDTKEIKENISKLTASPAERDYALKALYRSGAAAVPQLLDTLRSTKSLSERYAVRNALLKMGPETLPPLLAALDSDDAELKLDVLDVLRRAHARESPRIVPHLWYLSASKSQPKRVADKAREMLGDFLDVVPSKLLPAKVALTRLAERYYRHEEKFPNPDAVTIWRWDRKSEGGLAPGPTTVPATQAEEYWGLRFARQALDLDPSYAPAQEVFLSLALDKAVGRAGLDGPLAKAEPTAHALLSRSDAALVVAVLDRALSERRTPVALAALRNLGDRAEALALKARGGAQSPLTRALHYPDRRVQLAAALAALRIPGARTTLATGRVVDIFRRSLGGAPDAGGRPKVLVGYSDEDFRDKVGQAVSKAGYEPVRVNSGKNLMRRLAAADDVDLILIDAALPDPGLAVLLGQLKADKNASHLPVLLTVTPEPPPKPLPGRARFYKPAGADPAVAGREEKLRRFVERYPNVAVIPLGAALEPASLKKLVQARLAVPDGPALTEAERARYAEASVRALAALASGTPEGFDVTPAGGAVLNALREGKLSAGGQLAGIAVAGRIPGSRAQSDLAVLVRSGGRPEEVRLAAARELARHIQKNGAQLAAAEVAPLRELAAAKDTPAELKAAVDVLLGSLRPDARATGERLKGYTPTTPGVIPPPKEKKEE